MTRVLGVLALSVLAPAASARGTQSLDGGYRFASLFAEFGSGCGGSNDDRIGVESGTITFLPNGTWSRSSTVNAVCETGTSSSVPGGGAGSYVADVDGGLTLDPGPNETRAFLSRDLAALATGGERTNQRVNVLIGTRLASGLGTSALSGSYHIARVGFSNPGSGTSGAAWYGTASFDGAGAYTAAFAMHVVSATGSTTSPSGSAAGAYTVAGDGQVTLGGWPGGASFAGAVAANGALFFAVDTLGPDLALLVGVRFASGATNALADGAWGGGGLAAAFGNGSGYPEFCSSTIGLAFLPANASFFANETESCDAQSGSGVERGVGVGTFAMQSDGSYCTYEDGFPPCLSSAMDPTGTYAFEIDMTTGSEFSLKLILGRPFGAVTVCVGDGVGMSCPCGNDSNAGENVGCMNSLGIGGKLATSGTPSLTADSLLLSGTQMPSGSALYFQGTVPQNGGLGVAFGDGLRCAGGTVIRLGTRTNVGGSSSFPQAGDPTVSAGGLVAAPGTRVYQVWYRNAVTFCTSSTFNLTNGELVAWGA